MLTLMILFRYANDSVNSKLVLCFLHFSGWKEMVDNWVKGNAAKPAAGRDFII